MTAPTQVLAGWRCRWASSPGDPTPRVLVGRSPEGREWSIGEIVPEPRDLVWLVELLDPTARRYLKRYRTRTEEGGRALVELWVPELGGEVEAADLPRRVPPPLARTLLALEMRGISTVPELAATIGEPLESVRARVRWLELEGYAEVVAQRRGALGAPAQLWRARRP